MIKIFPQVILGDGLLPYIKDNENALNELNEFKSHRVRSLIGYGVCLGSVAIAALAGTEEDKKKVYDPRQGKEVSKINITCVGIAAIVLAVTGLIYGGYNYFAASEHMFNAVNIYNKDFEKNNPYSVIGAGFQLGLGDGGKLLLNF